MPESLRGRKNSMDYFTMEMGIKSLNRFGFGFFFSFYETSNGFRH